MNPKLVNKDDLPVIIGKLMDDFTVVGPVREGNVVKYRQINTPEEIDLRFLGPSNIPPKSILFPQREILFTYELDNKDVKITDPLAKVPDKQQIIFGIRPCDAKSFALLKLFFEWGDYKDVYYLEKFNNSIFVTLACNTAKSTCLCTSVGGDPFGTENSDLQLVDIGEKFVLRSSSDKGDTVLEKLPDLLEATSDDLETVETLNQNARESITTQLDLSDIDGCLAPLWEDKIWAKFSSSCLGCASCSYLCPTCHCFDVIDDRIDEHHGARIRIWDTCQFPIFTKQGSGYNPRDAKSARARQRLFHKFNYYPTNYGVIGCVGCGRCISQCPMNSDLRDELTQVKEIKSSS